MALVVDASVGLKWVLQEADSHLAHALVVSDEVLLVPDFWLNEACNVLWLQVRRGVLTSEEAREGLDLLRTQIEPTPTAELDRVVAADATSVRAAKTHPEPSSANMVLPLNEWAAERGPLAQ